MQKIICVRNVLLSCLACCLILVSAAASAAPVTYSYVGPNFDEYTAPYDSNNRVNIVFTTNDGLLSDTTGLEDITSSIDSWTISDGYYTVSNSTVPSPSSWDSYSVSFGVLAEVSGGDILQWDINYEQMLGNYGLGGGSFYNNWIDSSLTYTAALSGQRFDYGAYEEIIDNGMEILDYDGFGRYQHSFDILGGSDRIHAWTVSNSNNGSPVPEPSTMLLLGSGIVGLTGFGRKKFKK